MDPIRHTQTDKHRHPSAETHADEIREAMIQALEGAEGAVLITVSAHTGEGFEGTSGRFVIDDLPREERTKVYQALRQAETKDVMTGVIEELKDR